MRVHGASRSMRVHGASRSMRVHGASRGATRSLAASSASRSSRPRSQASSAPLNKAGAEAGTTRTAVTFELGCAVAAYSAFFTQRVTLAVPDDDAPNADRRAAL